jgi:hypothetical protein
LIRISFQLGALFLVELNSFQEADLSTNPLSFTLRASEISAEDLEVIACINRIALNSRYMTQLLKGLENKQIYRIIRKAVESSAKGGVWLYEKEVASQTEDSMIMEQK